jgi:o-succinylbenzoate synthase
LKIREFIVTPYSIPFVKPLQTSSNTYSHREGVWLNLKWENISGWGEAAPLPGFSNEYLQEVHYVLEGFHQAIDEENIEKEELLAMAEVHTQGYPSARFAVETALYDLFAQKAKKSLALYLNPHTLTEIAVNGITGIHMPGDGFKVMKVKVGFRNLFDEIEQMVMLTKSFGKDISFRLDANGAFDLSQAIRFCKEMEAFNIDYIEQPLPAKELVDLAELSYHTEIPIAIDESLTDFHSAEKIIENQAADVFIIKPMVSGGFRESKKIIQLAREENIRIVITSSLETNIGHLACLHLAAANEIIETCGLSTGKLLKNASKAPAIEKGIIQLPCTPGIGVELQD